MKYEQLLIKKIKASEEWPSFQRSDFLQELNTLADDAFQKDTIEGYLASILIYHQLSEEILKLLIDCSEFQIQIAIFPAEIEFRHGKKRMFGQLISELENTISFKKKKEIITKCKELNEIRIKMVHKLTSKTSIENIRVQSLKIKSTYDNIFSLFEDIYDNFKVIFHSYKKNGDWDDYIQ